MRIRARLFIPALAAAAMPAAGAGSAPAATLFTSNAHTVRVTVGATLEMTSVGDVDFTAPFSATVYTRCSVILLHARVAENSDVRTAFDVVGSTVAGCAPVVMKMTHTTPWTFTITGAGTMIGDRMSFAATLHRIAFDDPNEAVPFTGNLETLTATQTTTTTNNICVDLNTAGPVRDPPAALILIDARFCISYPASTWSLT